MAYRKSWCARNAQLMFYGSNEETPLDDREVRIFVNLDERCGSGNDGRRVIVTVKASQIHEIADKLDREERNREHRKAAQGQ